VGINQIQIPRQIHLHESGGRLSKALVMEHQEKIDEFFGQKTAEFVNTRKTLLL
jgi:hypothetical protein